MIFYMGCILEKALRLRVRAEILHVMNAKLSRRFLKYGPRDEGPAGWATKVGQVMADATAAMADEWKHIMAQDKQTMNIPHHGLERLSFQADVHMHLPALEVFTASIAQRRSTRRKYAFDTSEDLPHLSPSLLPSVQFLPGPCYPRQRLARFEGWVEHELDTWASSNRLTSSTCEQLAVCMKKYHAAATQAYGNNAELTSIMLLTLTELWVACDKSGYMTSFLIRRWERLLCRAHPLLCGERLQGGHLPGLDDAIEQVWSGYPPPGSWHIDPTHDFWLHTTTTTTTTSTSGTETDSEDGTDSQDGMLHVDFNLLTAELLVDGLPLSRLPSKYESHPLYRTLFGQAAIEVMPTRLPGMELASKVRLHGYHLGFGLQGPDFLVQAHAAPGHVYDLVPDRLTGHTGTEQALLILRSGSVRSFGALSAEHVALLLKVIWDGQVGMAAQAGMYLDLVVGEMLRLARRMAVFVPPMTATIEPLTTLHRSTDPWLHARAAARDAVFHSPGFGAHGGRAQDPASDQDYTSRERSTTDAAVKAYYMACYVLTQPAKLTWAIPSTLTQDIWAVWGQHVTGTSSLGREVGFDFDQSLLSSGAAIMSHSWFWLRRFLAQDAGSAPDRYRWPSSSSTCRTSPTPTLSCSTTSSSPTTRSRSSRAAEPRPAKTARSSSAWSRAWTRTCASCSTSARRSSS